VKRLGVNGVGLGGGIGGIGAASSAHRRNVWRPRLSAHKLGGSALGASSAALGGITAALVACRLIAAALAARQ